MISLHISNNYYIHKANIDKRNNLRFSKKILKYNNSLIDYFVNDFSERHEFLSKIFLLTLIMAALDELNRPYTYSQYNTLTKNKYTSNDHLTLHNIRLMAENRLREVVKLQSERILANVDYVKNVLKYNIIDAKEYNLAVDKEPTMANRLDVMRNIQDGKDKLLANGINVPGHVFSYRNPDILAESLARQTQMMTSFEKIKLINQKYKKDGKTIPYTEKTWIWTGEGKTTRHEINHGQTVGLNDRFTIINEANGEVDYLLYPSDPTGSPSNTYICYCEAYYH